MQRFTHLNKIWLSFNKNGVYFLSMLKSTWGTSFSGNQRERFNKNTFNLWEPDDYKIELNTIGKLYLFRFKSNLAQSFPRSPKKTIVRKSCPSSSNCEATTKFGYLIIRIEEIFYKQNSSPEINWWKYILSQ
jgi:hypothetical protein